MGRIRLSLALHILETGSLSLKRRMYFVYSVFVLFITNHKCSLNMRTAFNIYRQLGKYLEVVDAEAAARGEGSEDRSIDPHFRSGVYMGVGSSNLILSMMPSRLVTLIELFGYRGDRQYGLETLYKAGGWTKHSPEPSITHGKTENLLQSNLI